MRHVCAMFFVAALGHAQLLRVQNLAAPRFAGGIAVIAPGSLIWVSPDGRLTAGFGSLKDPSVRIRSGDTEWEAQLLEIHGASVLAVAPEAIQPGRAELSFSFTTTNGVTYFDKTSIVIAASSFELFYQTAQNNTPQGPLPNRPDKPARPGQFVTLWGTGLGNAAPEEVSVLLGGKPISPSSAGRAPGLPGLDQINFQVPDDPDIPDDCSVAIAVRVGPEASGSRKLSKTNDGSPCYYAPRYGLSDAQLSVLDAGRLPFGYIEITDNRDSFAQLHGYAEFGLVDAVGFASQFAPVFAEGYEPSCGVSPPWQPGLSSSGLSVGDAITLTGPGQAFRLGRSPSTTTYILSSASIQPVVSGDWQISIPGEGLVSAFSTRLDLPRPIELLNAEELRSIDRRAGAVIRWNPSGYSERDSVTVALVQAPGYGVPHVGVGCGARATDGRLSLTPGVLADFPVGGGLHTSLQVILSRSFRFSIPMKIGADLLTVFIYHSQVTAYPAVI